jgi:hypothetical protein
MRAAQRQQPEGSLDLLTKNHLTRPTRRAYWLGAELIQLNTEDSKIPFVTLKRFAVSLGTLASAVASGHSRECNDVAHRLCAGLEFSICAQQRTQIQQSRSADPRQAVALICTSCSPASGVSFVLPHAASCNGTLLLQHVPRPHPTRGRSLTDLFAWARSRATSAPHSPCAATHLSLTGCAA